MSVTESTPRRLVLRSGSTTLTLDKDADRATLQRKLLFWNLKPVEAPLSQISDVTIDKAVDRASGVEMFSTMLVTHAGAGWALSAASQADAEKRRLQSASFSDFNSLHRSSEDFFVQAARAMANNIEGQRLMQGH